MKTLEKRIYLFDSPSLSGLINYGARLEYKMQVVNITQNVFE